MEWPAKRCYVGLVAAGVQEQAELHDQLHWLGVPDRVLFKLAVTVHQCLNGCAPPYLSERIIVKNPYALDALVSREQVRFK